MLLGLFAGAAIGVGYLFSGVPNVELMTLVVALAGVALGASRGALVGAVAAAAYSLGSPYGLPVPLLLGAQILGFAGAGAGGGLAAPLLLRAGRGPRGAATAGILGALLTLLFDLLTNLAILLAYGGDPRVVIVGALPFAAVHVAVNTTLFALLAPSLAPRMALLGRGPLVGRNAGPLAVLAVAMVLVAPAAAQEAPAAAAGDSLAVAEPMAGDAVPAGAPLPQADAGPAALGWKRPLWTPFAWHTLNWLDWWSPRVTSVEAGLGAPAMILGEAGTSPMPTVTIDGVPWGTGHALADDAWLIPQQGLRWLDNTWFGDGRGGTAGRLNLVTDDPDPTRAVSTYRGVKGRHESYMRAIDVLTARADWRFAFAFDEVMDVESYNYSDEPDELFRPFGDEYRGHGKIRQSRTSLVRQLDPDNALTLMVSTGRKTKDDLPSWGTGAPADWRTEQQEIWDTGVAATMDGASGGVQWRGIAFWRDRDVQWGDQLGAAVPPANLRKLESSREGINLVLRPRTGRRQRTDADSTRSALPAVPRPQPLTSLTLDLERWVVSDSADTLQTLPPETGPVGGRGVTSRAFAETGKRFGGQRLTVGVGLAWMERAGLSPSALVALGQEAAAPRWRVEIGVDGRAPRSDELVTPVFRNIDGRRLTLLPETGLGYERTLRAGVVLQGRFLGNDLALDAAGRYLRDGINWTALSGQEDVGRWNNDLELGSTRVTAGIGRQGRVLGWGRIHLEGTWQTFDERGAQADFLPPEYSARGSVFWENHFFQEDGILEVGLIGRWHAEMDDPRDVTRQTRLPSLLVLDLMTGFRLVGVDLSLGIRNLTGQRTQLSAGTWSAGQEVNLRLHWSFRH